MLSTRSPHQLSTPKIARLPGLRVPTPSTAPTSSRVGRTSSRAGPFTSTSQSSSECSVSSRRPHDPNRTTDASASTSNVAIFLRSWSCARSVRERASTRLGSPPARCSASRSIAGVVLSWLTQRRLEDPWHVPTSMQHGCKYALVADRERNVMPRRIERTDMNVPQAVSEARQQMMAFAQRPVNVGSVSDIEAESCRRKGLKIRRELISRPAGRLAHVHVLEHQTVSQATVRDRLHHCVWVNHNGFHRAGKRAKHLDEFGLGHLTTLRRCMDAQVREGKILSDPQIAKEVGKLAL